MVVYLSVAGEVARFSNALGSQDRYEEAGMFFGKDDAPALPPEGRMSRGTTYARHDAIGSKGCQPFWWTR